ncbi:hypothetical protein COCON_G00020810 [Conger conger]|uniref:Uncharacterized protein n=1 Tax=Conger conger TaxID=82655 RepID=A0A9Q1I667_CONCO|nr:hypothetical protein COCON_G00020810 [Conger conger]
MDQVALPSLPVQLKARTPSVLQLLHTPGSTAAEQGGATQSGTQSTVTLSTYR